MADNRYSNFYTDSATPNQGVENQSSRYKNFYGENNSQENINEDERVRQQESWWEDPLQASRMALDGLTLGWSDELGSHAAAIALKLTGQAFDVPYSDLYNEVHSQIQSEMDDYRSKHRAASTALGVIGAVPTTLVGTPVNAGANLLRTVATGAGFGGIAGAGSAEQGNKVEGALLGTVLGGVFSGGIGSAGWLWNKSSSRKVVQDLGSGDKFVPITLAANTAKEGEAFLAGIYRDVISPSFGAYGKITGQEERIINPVISATRNAKANLLKLQSNAKDAVSRVKLDAKKAIASNKSSINARIMAEKESKKDAEALINSRFVTERDVALAESAKEVDRISKEALTNFRANAIRASIPEGTNKNIVKEIIDASTPNEAMRLIDKSWADIGFYMLKDKKFQLNPTNIAIQLEEKLGSFLFAKPVVKREVDNITEFLSEKVKKGWIDGNDLSEVRSRLGMLANSNSTQGGESAMQYAVYKDLQSVLNKHVESKLKGNAKEAFKAHTAQWEANTILRDSTLSASKKAGSMGEFSADDWVSSIAKLSPRKARQGVGVLRDEAEATARLIKDNSNTVKEATEVAVNNSIKMKEEAIKAAQERANKEIAKLNSQLKALSKKSPNDMTAKLRKAENKQAISYQQAELDKLEGALKTLKDNSSHKSATIFTRLAATGALGHGFNFVNLATGTLLGRGLASQSGQRILAGQAGWQEGMQRMYQQAIKGTNGNIASDLGILGTYQTLNSQ